MDIRNYFNKISNDKPTQSALSDDRKLRLSPAKTKQVKPTKVRAKAMLVYSDENEEDDSDGENPIPKSLRQNMKKVRRRVMISSDEEEFIPEPEKKRQKTLFNEVSEKSAKAANKKVGPEKPEDKKKKNIKNSPKSAKKEETPSRKPNPKVLIAEQKLDVSSNENRTSKYSRKNPTKISSPKKGDKSLVDVQKPQRSISNFDRSESNIVRERVEIPVTQMLWVDKHAPTNWRHLVGQMADKSPYKKLIAWLHDWPKNHLSGNVEKAKKPSFFASQSDGSAFKAVLISGPPGIGKTSSAIMACKELNLDYSEMNASDCRNKSSMDVQGQLLTNHKINFHPTTTTNTTTKKKAAVDGLEHVLIMDEVDGMSGNSDRAGIAELIQMIKRTRVPIICICNDRMSPKIRSMANHCFDVRFQRPRAEQIKGRLMTIASMEKLTLPKDTLDQMIEASNQDIRQCIHSLQMFATCQQSKPNNNNDDDDDEKNAFEKKDFTLNIFEAARQILSVETTLFEKQEIFFTDYSIMPLFVQENYLHVRASGIGNREHIKSIRKAADSIAFGDIIDKTIRSNGAWNLLVEQAMFSAALPALEMNGFVADQLNFPSWFGKNSNANKRRRLAQQLSHSTHCKISASVQALVTDYLPLLCDRIHRALLNDSTVKKAKKTVYVGVSEALEYFKEYTLSRDDYEAINELAACWSKNGTQTRPPIQTKIKAALTRALNGKATRNLPTAGVKRKNATVVDSDSGAEDAELPEEDELMDV